MPVKSCLMLTAEAVGHEITTVEGLQNTPVQQAFIDLFAFQCGYCTSGFLMVCHALSQLNPKPTDAEIDHWLESNICRCTSYEEIGKAIRAVLNVTAPHIKEDRPLVCPTFYPAVISHTNFL
jgi:aerobic-type carbon monoxide dehydrogenase small subunit (CoxS/CutS family)